MAWVDALSRRGSRRRNSSDSSSHAALVSQLESTAEAARKLREEGEGLNSDTVARLNALKYIEQRCARNLELITADRAPTPPPAPETLPLSPPPSPPPASPEGLNRSWGLRKSSLKDSGSSGGGAASAAISLYSPPPLLSPSSPFSPSTRALELQRTMFLAITAAWEAAMDASRGAAGALDAVHRAQDRIAETVARRKADAAARDVSEWQSQWQAHYSPSRTATAATNAAGGREEGEEGGANGGSTPFTPRMMDPMYPTADNAPGSFERELALKFQFDPLLCAPSEEDLIDPRCRPLALSIAEVAMNKAATASLTLADLARCDVAEKWCAPTPRAELTMTLDGGSAGGSPFLRSSAVMRLVNRATAASSPHKNSSSPARIFDRASNGGGGGGSSMSGSGVETEFSELRRLVQESTSGGADDSTSTQRLGAALVATR